MKPLKILISCLLFVSFFSAIYSQEKTLKDKRESMDLTNFLNTRLTSAYNYEPVYIPFTDVQGKFPDLVVNSPSTVKKFMGGDYSVDIKWFDADLNEVEKPHSPGRYAYYAEITGANGLVMRRSSTLFCQPQGGFSGWVEFVKTDVGYFPLGDIPRTVWEDNNEAISVYSGQVFLDAIASQQQWSGPFLSYLYEMDKMGLKPGPLNTPFIMDGDYHARLKQKILGVEGKYKKLALPKKVSTPAPTLQVLTDMEKSKIQTFEERMRKLCEDFIENGGHPFDILIAKDGKILFHDAFGEDLLGKFSKEEPTEIASITKLLSGLVFAQIVDQGIIRIDDPVADFLPGFASSGDKAITMRQCFTHTAGFSGHTSFGGVQNPWQDNSLALWLNYRSPGTYHEYNGNGYDLAGKVMEVTSGKSIFRIFREQMFDPLGLKNTWLDQDLAWGTKTTAYDLAVMGQMLLNKGKYGDLQFFSEETYNALLPVKLEDYFPEIKDREWGIGLTPSSRYITDEKTNEKRPLLSSRVVGHGSGTSSILNVDLENNIIIAQTRLSPGQDFYNFQVNIALLIEEYFVNDAGK